MGDDVDNIRDMICKGRMSAFQVWRAMKTIMTAEQKTCYWSRDDEESDTYESECGHYWTFIDGTIADNKTIYCPFCGGKIVEPNQPPEEEDDDDE
jgi:hypothetical protein